MDIFPEESLRAEREQLDPVLAQAMGQIPVGIQVLEASVLPAVILDIGEMPQADERRCAGPQSHQSQQSQQSYSSMNSQQSTRCSHGCHDPR